MNLNSIFRLFASAVSNFAGSPYVFIAAIFLIIGWAISGPFFNFSNTWQLAINTSTTIVTFLMVFLIQNTQNRDSKAIHLKLDELIKALKGARDEIIDIENLPDEVIDQLQSEFQEIKKKYEIKTADNQVAKSQLSVFFDNLFKSLSK